MKLIKTLSILFVFSIYFLNFNKGFAIEVTNPSPVITNISGPSSGNSGETLKFSATVSDSNNSINDVFLFVTNNDPSSSAYNDEYFGYISSKDCTSKSLCSITGNLTLKNNNTYYIYVVVNYTNGDKLTSCSSHPSSSSSVCKDSTGKYVVVNPPKPNELNGQVTPSKISPGEKININANFTASSVTYGKINCGLFSKRPTSIYDPLSNNLYGNYLKTASSNFNISGTVTTTSDNFTKAKGVIYVICSVYSSDNSQGLNEIENILANSNNPTNNKQYILGYVNNIEMLSKYDFNKDDKVSSADLSIFLVNFNTDNTSYDLNKDNKVNGADLSILLPYIRN